MAAGAALTGSWWRDAAHVTWGRRQRFIHQDIKQPAAGLIYTVAMLVSGSAAVAALLGLKKQWRFTRVTLVIYPAETHVTILEFHRWEKFFLKSTRETCVLTLLPRQRGRRAGAVFSCVSVVLQRCRHTQLQPSRCSHSTCRMSRRQAKQIEQDRKSGLKTSGTF